VYILLCRIYSYFSCRRLKQSSEASYKVSRDLQCGQRLGEAHASEVHTSGVHTPLKDTTPKHQITTAIQLPTLICGVEPTCSHPTPQRPKPGSLTRGREEAQEKNI
jgi:hypothetical protein